MTQYTKIQFGRENEKNKIESGDVEINGKNYNYCVSIYEIALGKCLLIKMLCRNVNPTNNCRVYISYTQYIEGYSLCEEWTDKELTSDEKEYLKKFLDDSESDIEFKDYHDPAVEL